MGTTTNYKWPYPEPSDAPNVPLHVQNALKAADVSVKGIEDTARRVNVAVYNSTGPSIPNTGSSNTAIKWSAANYANGGTWWAANSEWLTVPVTGIYQMIGIADYNQGNATGWKTAEIWSQDTGGQTTFLRRTTLPSVAWTQEVAAVYEGRLTAGTKVKLVTNQTTGAALVAYGWMTARLVGA